LVFDKEVFRMFKKVFWSSHTDEADDKKILIQMADALADYQQKQPYRDLQK